MTFNIRSIPGVFAALMLSGAAGAVSLDFSHAYGEIVDRGDLSAHIRTTNATVLECPTSVSYAQVGNRITLTTRQAAPGQTDVGTCWHTASVVLGQFAAGTYEITGRIRSFDGATFESVTETVHVLPIDGRCNADPAMSPSIVGRPAGQSAPDFVARVRADPAFAALLGNPAVRVAPYGGDVYFDYPPLDDIPPAMDRLARSGALASQWRNAQLCFSSPPIPDVIAQFVEYFHESLDYYFVTGDAGEIAAIDRGDVGAWVRTGKTFHALTAPGCPFSQRQTVVYRLNNASAGAGHFFTRDRAECSLATRNGIRGLEGIPFWASAPGADGICATAPGQTRASIPLFRMWRPFGPSAHRFSTDRSVMAVMVAKGWIAEGIAMCVLAPP